LAHFATLSVARFAMTSPETPPTPAPDVDQAGPDSNALDPVTEPEVTVIADDGSSDAEVPAAQLAQDQAPTDLEESAGELGRPAEPLPASPRPPARRSDFHAGTPHIAGAPVVALLAEPMDVPAFAPEPGDRLWRWGVLTAIYALYLIGCGGFGLWDPWETHYGEVTRYMIETWDWVNPWWGYKQKIGTEGIAGEWFYSKPVYIFWAEATFIKLIGLTDWALRLPIALLGASMCSAIYLATERILSRRHAVWATAVVVLSPFVYMTSRQAQTDMPYVATLGMGLAFALTALFGRRQVMTPRQFGWMSLGFLVFLLANLVPQFAIIASDLYDPNTTTIGETIQQNGIWHVLLFYLPVTALIVGSIGLALRRQAKTAEGWTPAFADSWFRRYLLMAAMMLFAQSTYAKGLLGFLLPGAILVLYMLTTRSWRLIGKLDLGRGIPLFFVTVSPWYVAMFCRHGWPYYQRFFIHDHFNRVGAGVHQIDTGTFEYFVEWLGYGLFPWSAVVPLALVAAVAALRTDRGPAVYATDERGALSAERYLNAASQHLQVFAFLWFLLSFFLFTLSSTRFHHYILPGVPPLAMLTGLYLLRLRQEPASGPGSGQGRLAAVLGLGLLVLLTVNLLSDYQNLRILFTYKYDRPMPDAMPFDWNEAPAFPQDTSPLIAWGKQPFGQHVGTLAANLLTTPWLRFERIIPVFAILSGLGLLLFAFRRARGVGFAVLASTAGLMAFWTLNQYMPSLAPHWSQKYLFEAYYTDCTLYPNPQPIEDAFTPLVRRAGLDGVADFFDSKSKRVCKEDIVSWLITWRGETYYSNNEIRPLNKATQLGPYLQEMNKGKTFYALLERGRNSGFESKVKGESRKLRDQAVSGFTDIADWNCSLISNDSAYFSVTKCVPTKGPLPVAAPAKPGAKPAAKPARPPAEEGGKSSSPNPSF